MNLAESAESSSEVEIQEINSIRRKAKALQIDGRVDSGNFGGYLVKVQVTK